VENQIPFEQQDWRKQLRLALLDEDQVALDAFLARFDDMAGRSSDRYPWTPDGSGG